MVDDAVTHLPRQIQALSVVLQQLDDAQALAIMRKSVIKAFLHGELARVAEGGMSDIVPHGNGTG